MLVVVTIIGVLMGLVLSGVMAAKRHFNIADTKAIIQLIGAAIDQYQFEWGDYPPGAGGAAGSQELYRALVSPANSRPYLSGSSPPVADPDGSGHKVLVDHWRRTIYYTHHRNYAGDPNKDLYRLQSAGPDGQYGNDDDITNWKK
jgi:type II secretory pathway pseudopilin PulG